MRGLCSLVSRATRCAASTARRSTRRRSSPELRSTCSGSSAGSSRPSLAFFRRRYRSRVSFRPPPPVFGRSETRFSCPERLGAQRLERFAEVARFRWPETSPWPGRSFPMPMQRAWPAVCNQPGAHRAPNQSPDDHQCWFPRVLNIDFRDKYRMRYLSHQNQTGARSGAAAPRRDRRHRGAARLGRRDLSRGVTRRDLRLTPACRLGGPRSLQPAVRQHVRPQHLQPRHVDRVERQTTPFKALVRGGVQFAPRLRAVPDPSPLALEQRVRALWAPSLRASRQRALGVGLPALRLGTYPLVANDLRLWGNR